LIALVPNAIPLIAVFGIMGLLGIPLDAGTALIGSLALGIAVDDTIHIVSGYHARVLAGLDRTQSLLGTFQATLPAISATTIMVSVAFLVLGFSEFTITRNLGLVTASIMALCLAADISLLPVLLLRYCSEPAPRPEI
jgi:hypothetical protein